MNSEKGELSILKKKSVVILRATRLCLNIQIFFQKSVSCMQYDTSFFAVDLFF